jgi:hypothetical protein
MGLAQKFLYACGEKLFSQRESREGKEKVWIEPGQIQPCARFGNDDDDVE